MPDKIERTESVYRTYDESGNLTQEVTTTIVTRTPEPGTVTPPFGIRAPEGKRQ
jgi:hypothetical protein